MDIRIGNLNYKNILLKINLFILIKGIIYISWIILIECMKENDTNIMNKFDNKRNLIYIENSRTIINQSF